MFANDIGSINDGTTNHTYSLISLGNDGAKPSSVRKDTAASGDLPATLTIKHQLLGKGDDTVTSSLVRFDRVVERSSDQKQGTISAYLVLKAPSKLTDAATVTKSLNELISFLGLSGTVTRLLNTEP